MPVLCVKGSMGPYPEIRYLTPCTYSDGFHTATTFQIVSAQAEISPESTWNSTMLSKVTWIWGAIYAHSDQMKGRIGAPQSKNPLSGPSHL